MATLHQKIALGALGLLLLLASPSPSLAAEIKILFLPPPMEGTISLGIYDSGGKLVRVLHNEAEVSEFASALNGLITYWDGNDDKGGACPPGKYHARGFMVGDIDVDGVDFHGNDWVTEDDSPHICRITDIATKADDDSLALTAILPGQIQANYVVSFSGTESDPGEPRLVPSAFAYTDSKLFPAKGADKVTWKINGGTVEESSSAGIIHSIVPKPGDPIPVKIAPSRVSDKVYVLEENSAVQRLRGLEFTGTATEPTVLFEKTIRLCDRFEQVAATLTFPGGKPFVSASTLTLTLVPNPLFQDKPGKVDIAMGMDEKGSFLATADGLPLYRISETPHLRWAVMGRPEGVEAVTIFESDGAVVSEFKAEHLGQMMAFDAGELQLAATSASPPPTGKQDGEPAPSATANSSPQPSPAPSSTASPQPSPVQQPSPQASPAP